MEKVYQLKIPISSEEDEYKFNGIVFNEHSKINTIQLLYSSYDGLLIIVINPESDSFIEPIFSSDPHINSAKSNEKIMNLYDRIVDKQNIKRLTFKKENKVKKKKYPKYFTTGELKKLFDKVPNDLPVGTSGHFGEFLMMTKYDFRISEARLIQGDGCYWRDADDHKSPIFSITSPDPGPEPD